MLLIGGKMITPTGLSWATRCVPEDPNRLTLNPKCYRTRDTGLGEGALAGVAHTIHGNLTTKRPPVIPGGGPPGRAFIVIKNWNRAAATRPASAHVVVDYDGTIYNVLDLVVNASYSVGTVPKGSKKLADRVNGWTISLEMCQLDDGRVYQNTVTAAAAFLDWCATRFEWPKVYPAVRVDGDWSSKEIDRGVLLGKRGAFGHRNCKPSNRGPGDPGPYVFKELADEFAWEGWPVVTGTVPTTAPTLGHRK